MKIEIRGEELILDEERALYLPNEKLLAISDLHLGKAAHFRKAGLAIPNTVSKSDLDRLGNLLKKYRPKTLLINGDMFHSEHNTEIDEFAKWKENFSEVGFLLVKGNHDRQKKRSIKIWELKFMSRLIAPLISVLSTMLQHPALTYIQ
ncbi:metallophosphoesterase [Pedobacter sp. SL55]|uniref:metallophosphoesterase n=1 Tax=Pedobacter sp. SL55 TaxID=2995161 RepID=UPI0022710BDF|nr:metallophosphoesterase [Pedobacter sp. SL55]WAC39546.1 metallophosphoesterase [Pedobacter sp. SL55]